MTREELAVDHPYYASDSNWCDNDANGRFETMTDFLDEYEGCDVDLNLCYRWDVYKPDPEEGESHWWVQVVIIKQRKGIYSPIRINAFEEHEVERFVTYLQKHKERLIENWLPL